MITPYLMFSGILLTLAVAIMGTTATAQGKNPIVVIETSLGSITAELYADKTPISVRNFLSYIESDFYSGTIFHRVIKGFMIQGGGMTADMTRKPTEAPIKNEATNGLSNERGTLAMARTAEVDSASSQFFINTVKQRRPRPRSPRYDTGGVRLCRVRARHRRHGRGRHDRRRTDRGRRRPGDAGSHQGGATATVRTEVR